MAEKITKGGPFNASPTFTILKELKALINEMRTDVDLNGAALEAILTKIDAGAGTTDTDFVALHGRAGSGDSIQAAAITAGAITVLVTDS